MDDRLSLKLPLLAAPEATTHEQSAIIFENNNAVRDSKWEENISRKRKTIFLASFVKSCMEIMKKLASYLSNEEKKIRWND